MIVVWTKSSFQGPMMTAFEAMETADTNTIKPRRDDEIKLMWRLQSST
jgi:hypothetical protein